MMPKLGNGNAVVGGGMEGNSNEIRRESCSWPGLILLPETQTEILGHQLQATGRDIRPGGDENTDIRRREDKHHEQQAESP